MHKRAAVLDHKRSPQQLRAHFGGDVESITVGGKVVYRARKETNALRLGRVIRRYHTGIPIGDFDKWQTLLRQRARGYGLYALYYKKRLIYAGLATNSIRARIRAHLRRGTIPFTHFSVFLVTGRSAEAQARRLQAIGDEPRQIIRRPRLHARWNFFGEKLEEKLGHRALTSQRREDAALGPFSPASGKEKKDFRRPLLSLSLSRLRERRGPGNALALPGK